MYTIVSVTNYVKKRFSTYGSGPQFLITNEMQVNIHANAINFVSKLFKCLIKQISLLLKNKIQFTFVYINVIYIVV